MIRWKRRLIQSEIKTTSYVDLSRLYLEEAEEERVDGHLVNTEEDIRDEEGAQGDDEDR